MKFVFDLGNVVVYFKPTDYLTGLGYSGAALAALKTAIFDSAAWLKCDAGALTRAQEIEEICAAHPEIEPDIRAVMARCDEMLTPIPESVRALERLCREGYECYYLSNTNAPAMEFIRAFDYFKLFRGGVASYAERLSKPDPAIFKLLAARFSLNPAECVFIDDNLANVVAARACGYDARQLCDADGLYAMIDEILSAERDLRGNCQK